MQVKGDGIGTKKKKAGATWNRKYQTSPIFMTPDWGRSDSTRSSKIVSLTPHT